MLELFVKTRAIGTTILFARQLQKAVRLNLKNGFVGFDFLQQVFRIFPPWGSFLTCIFLWYLATIKSTYI